jgi:hypothetical protein
MTIADAGFMPGIELSQVLYEEAVRPLLGETAGGRLRSGNRAEPAIPSVASGAPWAVGFHLVAPVRAGGQFR